MTKRVQLLGHEAEVANAFIGLVRELTVDTTNMHLVLHDGATPGGFWILNRDENDLRYQARSVELDGLLGWEPNERGILARQGPSNYDLLTIEVNTEQLTIDFANGFGGNPLIAFAPTITTDHTWSGEHTFSQAITGTGGFVGNVLGNVTGNLLGNVTGNVTGNLTGNAAGNHTGTFTGTAVLTAVTLPADCVDFAQLSPAVADQLDAIATFVGLICMYSGLVGDIPANWALCDGTNGTPDLRDRFIVCAGVDYLPDDTGGSDSHNVTIASGGAHAHTGTVGDTTLTTAQIPAHYHGNGFSDNNAAGKPVMVYGTMAAPAGSWRYKDDGNAGATLQGLTETVGGGGSHNHSLTVDSGGAHTHTGTTDAGSVPPYYALMFVMRIS